MNVLTVGASVAALLGSALFGGAFFAFSNFVMKAPARVPSAEGIAAMQFEASVVIEQILTHLERKEASTAAPRLPPCRAPPEARLFG